MILPPEFTTDELTKSLGPPTRREKYNTWPVSKVRDKMISKGPGSTEISHQFIFVAGLLSDHDLVNRDNVTIAMPINKTVPIHAR